MDSVNHDVCRSTSLLPQPHPTVFYLAPLCDGSEMGTMLMSQNRHNL